MDFFNTPFPLLSIQLVFQAFNIAIWEEFENRAATCSDGGGCAAFIPVAVQLHP